MRRLAVGELGWRGGESARLPPMCPGFDSPAWCHMWVEFVVGSRPSSEGFSPSSPVFLPPQKSTFLNSNSIGDSRATSLPVEHCFVLPSLNKVNLFIYVFILAFLLPPGWDARLSHGYPIYTPGWREHCETTPPTSAINVILNLSLNYFLISLIWFSSRHVFFGNVTIGIIQKGPIFSVSGNRGKLLSPLTVEKLIFYCLFTQAKET